MNVYLDNILLVDEPIGLNEDGLEEVIDLDLTLHGYVLLYEFPLTFVGDGYDYIYQKKLDQGFCAKIEIRIEVPTEQGTNIATGFFFLSDCEFNHTSFTVETEITDATYGVFISEAKDLKISPMATSTRGGEALTPVVADDITLFVPSTGANLATAAKMFEIAAVYEHIIKYLSDNGLDFAQTYFTQPFDFFFSNNYYMRNRGINPDVQFSFLDISRGTFKLFGLWFKIDNSTNPSTFTIVQGEENFFEEFDGIQFNNIRDLKESFYPERFFSTVEVGDDEAIIERGTTYQLPTVPLVGFREEVYNAQSDCTLSNTLDLKSDWIIDHNKIEEIVITGDDNERPVLVYADGNDAYKGTYAKQGVMRYYNEEILNFKVLARHNIPSSLSQGLGADTASFKAYKTADSTVTASGSLAPVDFDDDTPPGFDTGGNYNTGTFRYVAPSDGSYKFNVNLEYIVNDLQVQPGGFVGSGRVDIAINIRKRDSGGSVLQTFTQEFVHLTPTGASVIKTATAEFFLEATDYVDVDVSYTFLFPGASNSVTFLGLYNVDAGSWFETIYTFNNGGIADVTNINDYRASALKFEDFPITAAQWTRLKNNPSQGIHVNNGGNNTLCWIKNIKRNLKTGKATCEMISSPFLTQL
jgi:hypothetical protein